MKIWELIPHLESGGLVYRRQWSNGRPSGRAVCLMTRENAHNQNEYEFWRYVLPDATPRNYTLSYQELIADDWEIYLAIGCQTDHKKEVEE